MKRYVIWLSILLMIALLSACGEENTAPIIDEFIVPKTVAPGSQVDFQVVAHDADRDILTYTWKVDKTQQNATTPTITWKAPNIDQYVTVEVRVSDGVNDPVILKKTLKVGKSEQEERQEFISFLDRLGLVSNGDTPFAGMLMWNFSSAGVVAFGVVEARIGNSWLVTLYAGDYTLSSKKNSKGEYTASCHFILKESRFLPDSEVIAQVKHDEKLTVRLKREGNALLINGRKFEKFGR